MVVGMANIRIVPLTQMLVQIETLAMRFRDEPQTTVLHLIIREIIHKEQLVRHAVSRLRLVPEHPILVPVERCFAAFFGNGETTSEARTVKTESQLNIESAPAR